MIDKNSYYVNFDTTQFLGGKELLKSMPALFNRVYFCKKYGNALWDGEKEEHFPNIALLTKAEDIQMIRNIIKNNFLYIQNWDSIKYADVGDYGFSFIAGNIKYIIMPFREEQDNYLVRYYDVDTGMCYDTTLVKNKEYFLDSSINKNGEFVRTCDFDLEEINDTNTKKHIAEKKKQPEIAVYNSNSGYADAAIYINLGLVSILLLTIIFLMTLA